jgi:hypothetical protein
MRALIVLTICLSMLFYADVSLSESDEICCTWINLKYIHGKSPQKVVFHHDGTYATYGKIDSVSALSRGTFQVVKKWTDSEGFIWYNIIMNDPRKEKKYKLARVSKNGRNLEFVCIKDNYPTAINPDATGYCNYMRASMDYE